MPKEPDTKQAIAFFDGQNLFHCAKAAFGITYPNFDPIKLAQAVCQSENWKLKEVRFYTGLPDPKQSKFDAKWNHFWTHKLRTVGRHGRVVTRPLQYTIEEFELKDGTIDQVKVSKEKGIDVRIALDVLTLAWKHQYDVAVIFSQDQDLREVVDEVKSVSIADDIWLQVVSAFPVAACYSNKRGIHGTKWVRFDQATYDACVDMADYFPPRGVGTQR